MQKVFGARETRGQVLCSPRLAWNHLDRQTSKRRNVVTGADPAVVVRAEGVGAGLSPVVAPQQQPPPGREVLERDRDIVANASGVGSPVGELGTESVGLVEEVGSPRARPSRRRPCLWTKRSQLPLRWRAARGL